MQVSFRPYEDVPDAQVGYTRSTVEMPAISSSRSQKAASDVCENDGAKSSFVYSGLSNFLDGDTHGAGETDV
jgi:hypothetical protein